MSGNDRQMFRRLLKWMKPDAGLYVLALSAAPISAALTVWQPRLLQEVIDNHITPGISDGLTQAALVYLGVVVVGFLLESAHTLLLSFAAMKTITRVRRKVYEHTMSLAQRWFDREPTGRALTRATSDVEALGETLTAGAITIILDVFKVVGILIGMIALDPGMTLTVALVAPPLAIAINLLRRRLKVLYLEIRTTLAELNAYVSERFLGVRTVQLYRDEQRTVDHLEPRLQRYTKATIRTNIWDALMFAMVDGVGSVTIALMLVYGMGWGDGLTAGVIAAFIDYTGRLFRPIQEFSQKVATIQRASAALTKITDLLDDDAHITPGSEDASDARSISIRDLSFAYPGGADVLKHVSFDVHPNQVVALVGRTGSGKSTIGRVITRTYDGYRGNILLGGRELRDVGPGSVRDAIAVIEQDVRVFEGTVRFNLALGADITDERLMASVRLVHAEDLVDRLGGLDGAIREEGGNLSVGEIQLLSFARVLARDNPIVVMDEATASVDSLTEAKIQAAIRAVLARRTVIAIAHRLSTIRDADQILVLDHGEVLESGNHAALMAKGGAYASLVRNADAAHD